MDRDLEEQVDGWMGGQTDKQVNSCPNSLKDRWTDGQTNKQMDGQMSRGRDGWMDV